MPTLEIPKPDQIAPGHIFALGGALKNLEPLPFQAVTKSGKPKKAKKPSIPHVAPGLELAKKGLSIELKNASASPAMYSGIHDAFNALNAALFKAKPLPEVIFTLQRKPKSHGYFHGAQFESKDASGASALSEIALHPESLKRAPLEVLATLAHEMVHLWQWNYGKPGKKGYHNPQWAVAMQAIGLMPSHDGTKEGKKTGYKMTHLIVPGGLFEVAALALIAKGWSLSHYAKAPPSKEGDGEGKPKRNGARVKYVCPMCNNAMWGKGGQIIKCKGAGGDTHESSFAMLYKGMVADMKGAGVQSVVSQTFKSGPVWMAFVAELDALKAKPSVKPSDALPGCNCDDCKASAMGLTTQEYYDAGYEPAPENEDENDDEI